MATYGSICTDTVPSSDSLSTRSDYARVLGGDDVANGTDVLNRSYRGTRFALETLTLSDVLIAVRHAHAALPTHTFVFVGSVFDNRSIILFSWDFGDGEVGLGPEITHSYVQTGVYPVTLTVIDTRGLRNTTTRTVTVT